MFRNGYVPVTKISGAITVTDISIDITARRKPAVVSGAREHGDGVGTRVMRPGRIGVVLATRIHSLDNCLCVWPIVRFDRRSYSSLAGQDRGWICNRVQICAFSYRHIDKSAYITQKRVHPAWHISAGA